MKVQAKIDPESREIVLLYQDGDNLNAEVYRFHDSAHRIATHYNYTGVYDWYIKRLRDPLPFEEQDVLDAITFYQDLLGKKIERS